MSIGHRILAGGVDELRDGTRKLTKTEICELSLVTIPANASASIRLVKSLAQESALICPATGTFRIVAPTRARGYESERSPNAFSGLESKRAIVAQSMLSAMEKGELTERREGAAENDRWRTRGEEPRDQIGRWKDTEKQLIATASAVSVLHARVVSP